MSHLSTKALEVAKTQIGKRENPIGSNWGRPVQDYLLSVGINFPASWCMAFVYWCFKQAAEKEQIPNTAIRTGGVINAWNKGLEFRHTEPSVGSVFIMSLGHGLGHTGFVYNFDDKYIYTIEGNTNDTGSREGFVVLKRKRLRSTIKGYLNY